MPLSDDALYALARAALEHERLHRAVTRWRPGYDGEWWMLKRQKDAAWSAYLALLWRLTDEEERDAT